MSRGAPFCILTLYKSYQLYNCFTCVICVLHFYGVLLSRLLRHELWPFIGSPNQLYPLP